MPRITEVQDQDAPAEVAQIFAGIREQQGGLLPNAFRGLANAPAVLRGTLGLLGELHGSSTFSRPFQQQIAVRVAALDHSSYCVAANRAFGRMVGLNEAQLDAAQQGRAGGEKEAALLHFIGLVVENRAQIRDEDLAELRRRGVSDQEIVEAMGHVGLHILINYFNVVARTTPDPFLDA